VLKRGRFNLFPSESRCVACFRRNKVGHVQAVPFGSPDTTPVAPRKSRSRSPADQEVQCNPGALQLNQNWNYYCRSLEHLALCRT
jgi:hypothetical protein